MTGEKNHMTGVKGISLLSGGPRSFAGYSLQGAVRVCLAARAHILTTAAVVCYKRAITFGV
jgi:hypothetical protein